MNRYATVVAILTAVLIALALNLAVTIHNAERITKQVTVVCAEHKTVAQVAKEEFEEQEQTSKTVLPRLSFGGLTHTELIKLTIAKELRQQARAAKLEVIARETC